jgi:hypothetical protein
VATIAGATPKGEGPERQLQALVSVRVLAYDEQVVSRDRATGPVLVGVADACSTYAFINVFATSAAARR